MNQIEHERRQHPRKSANFQIKIQNQQNHDKRTVELRDISEGGLSFIVEHLDDYNENQRLGVNIPEYDEQGVLSYQQLNAEIVWLQHKDLLNPHAWVGLNC
ncbi:MAG: PilZ domain-containing protein [Mariprofundaceae bacterium]|nr:PilZ domain-containing protein [Mariprofundaceae bacterium]